MSERVLSGEPQKHIYVDRKRESLADIVAVQRFFNEAAPETVGADEADVELSLAEQTPEGFIALGWQYVEAQQALSSELKFVCENQPVSSWPKVMQERTQSSKETQLLADVDWKEHLPHWHEERAEDWPEDFQPDLLMLRELDAKLSVLSRSPELQADARELWQERRDVMQQAAEISRRKNKITTLTTLIANIRARSAEMGKPLSSARRQQVNDFEAELAQVQDSLYKNTLPQHLLPELVEEIERRDRRELRRQFEQGLVQTESMRQIVHEALPSLMAGNPALFVGETGGAKTALAKYLARECMGKEPEIVSGYDGVNGYQLMGKTGLVAKDGATVSEFLAGPVIRAMEEGRPLILDEINAMPPEFLKRLNEITQLRAGDTMSIQEDSGRTITVARGFCVLATANEKSKRYSGVHNLSTEFRNRFTANTYRVGYPDADVVTGQDPLDNYAIAYAAASDKLGTMLFEEGPEKLEAFARAAHMTQRLFSGHIGEGLTEEEQSVLGSSRIADRNAPGLDENVLAPRTMVALIEKVIDSHGGLTLQQVLDRWIESVKNTHDKQTITSVLRTRGLIDTPEEA